MTMLAYFLYKTPFIIIQMLPAATLISVIIMFCLMKKNNEITAMKSCGLDIFKLSQPIITLSLLIVLAIFLFSEIVVTYASSKSNEIWNIEVEKKDPGSRFYGRNFIWYKGSDCIYWIRDFNNKKMIMERPTFFFFDRGFRLTRRIDGRRAIWKDGKWKVEEGIIQDLRGDGDYQLTRFSEHFLKLPETPETFIRGAKSPEEMSYWQLKKYVERVSLEGYDNTRYLVDMDIKVAFPFIILIMTLIGIPISLAQKKVRTPLVISIGMGICFIYMLTLGFSRSLGLSGVLPPILSAWLANLVFFFLGIYLMMHVER